MRWMPNSPVASKHAKPRAKGLDNVNNITLHGLNQTASEFGIERLPSTDHCPICLTLANRAHKRNRHSDSDAEMKETAGSKRSEP